MILVLFAESRAPVLQYWQVLMLNQEDLLQQLAESFISLRQIQMTHLRELVQHLHFAVRNASVLLVRGRHHLSWSIYIYVCIIFNTYFIHSSFSAAKPLSTSSSDITSLDNREINL